ncbi:acetyltransferase [Brevundimonas nasdae]|jgi:putative acetyltransferase|uniref:Acetyltransferase n=1 Tax=Brevundimonas nasdae TaxID=172043 RepID=A0A0B4D1N8_9CAUL|nr:acetyltransferase [Brevundimonas nasdae]
MSTAVHIRPYNEADLDVLIDLFVGSVRQVASRDYSPAQIEAWAPVAVNREHWATRLGSRPTYVAEARGQIVGFSDLEPDGHIDMLFVHADHQGKGVARALLDHILARAHEQGIDRLFTEASITARQFFERSGFEVIKSQDVELRGQTFRNYRMVKSL